MVLTQNRQNLIFVTTQKMDDITKYSVDVLYHCIGLY